MGAKYDLIYPVQQLKAKSSFWSAATSIAIILCLCIVLTLQALNRSQTPTTGPVTPVITWPTGCQHLAVNFNTTAVVRSLQEQSARARQYTSSAPQKMHIVTVIGSDTPIQRLRDSPLLRGLPIANGMRERVQVLQANTTIGHHGRKMFSAFGGKIIELHKFVTSPHVAPTDLVLFTDGLDVVIDAKSLEDIPARFAAIVNNGSHQHDVASAPMPFGLKGLSKSNHQRLGVVFSAEQACWPDSKKHTCYPKPTFTPYHYLNSGGFIGHAAYLEAILQPLIHTVNKGTDDQGFYTDAYLALQENNGFFLDRNCTIFQTFYNVTVAPDGDLVFDDSMRTWYNTKTRTFPVLLHGNGATKKVFFDKIVPRMSESWEWDKHA